MKFTRVLAWILFAGGVSWLAKVGVIVWTDGEVVDSGAAAVFYLLGVALLAVGSIALGLRVTRGRAPWLRALAGAASVAVLLVSISVLDTIAKAVIGDLGDAYMRDEHGIWLTALVWLMVAVALLRDRRGAVDAA